MSIAGDELKVTVSQRSSLSRALEVAAWGLSLGLELVAGRAHARSSS